MCVSVGVCVSVSVCECACVQMVMSFSVSVWRFSDGRLNLMFSISRMSRDAEFLAEPMILKASRSKG